MDVLGLLEVGWLELHHVVHLRIHVAITTIVVAIAKIAFLLVEILVLV